MLIKLTLYKEQCLPSKQYLEIGFNFYNIVHSLSVCMRANIIDLFCGKTTFIAFEKAFDLQARKLIIHDCNYKI